MNHPSVQKEGQYGAHNYHPLPVVLVRGEGIYLWDIEGKRYIDMMSAYSAVSHGHAHPRLVRVLSEQASQLGVVSRAFYHPHLGDFLERACQVTNMERALPMNSGAEAVETALKAARKWAYQVKGIASDQAEIIVCQGNFHGRTTTIVGFSSEHQYRDGFGPFSPGFKHVPYGDLTSLKEAINERTAALLIEPIQGEGGIVVPPTGFLKAAAEVCQKNHVLFLADEIQTGLGRTGAWLACHHEGVQPDGVMLGKALGGGLLPVSLFLSTSEVMNVFRPGNHGSTFGGYPLAAAVGLEALNVLEEEGLVTRSAELGHYLLTQLRARLTHPAIKDIRGKGLLIGIEVDPQQVSAREICLRLMERGVLTKDTHGTVIRLAPPLVIDRTALDEVVDHLTAVW